jgi:hypothetical protein
LHVVWKLATKVDSKQMSEAEAQFEFDRFTSEVVSQADQRDAARAAVAVCLTV